MSLMVNYGYWFNFTELFTRSGKAGGLQILRCQGFAVDGYGLTLGALTLKPTGFCNTGVKSAFPSP